MGTGRDDFSQDTIRKAAMRVGYHCSFPGCLNATVGASMESASKVSMTGVAAHICAAAKGGPRYDANMTAQERSGIENCIWLCQTHSKLIDTDVKKYTVDLLRKWKSEAENRASKELANSDYFSEYYKGNGDNLNILEQLFDDFVSNGQFKQLDTMLKQYKSSLSEQYEEFVLRYKIIYDIYCSREDLPAHLQSYCALPCKSGVDMLAELFLSFHMLAELKTVESFCTDPVTKEYVSMEMSGSLIKQLLVPGGSQPSISLPDKIRKTIAKYITNQIISGNLFNVTDSDGKPYRLYSDEFYYRHHHDGVLPRHRLSRRLPSGTQQVQAQKRAFDAVHSAHVDQFRAPHHRPSRTSGLGRTSGHAELSEHDHRHGLRLSALYDPAPVHDAGKTRYQPDGGGVRFGRKRLYRVHESDLSPLHAWRHQRHHHGLYAEHDQLRHQRHAQQFQYHHSGKTHRRILHHL